MIAMRFITSACPHVACAVSGVDQGPGRARRSTLRWIGFGDGGLIARRFGCAAAGEVESPRFRQAAAGARSRRDGVVRQIRGRLREDPARRVGRRGRYRFLDDRRLGATDRGGGASLSWAAPSEVPRQAARLSTSSRSVSAAVSGCSASGLQSRSAWCRSGCVAVSLISAGAMVTFFCCVPGDRQPERCRDDDREQPDRKQ